MKNLNFLSTAIVAMVTLLYGELSAFAHDFEVDGIFYNITDEVNKIVAVTFKGSLSEYSNEYSGEVVIPSSVFHDGNSYSVAGIGAYAFQNCQNLTSVTISNSVTKIDAIGLFYNCDNLNALIVENGNLVYDSRDKCNAIIETTTNKLILGCKNSIIPNSIKSIGDAAFMLCNELTQIKIPNSVTKIGNCAFKFCKKLTGQLIFPENVTEIGNEAFFGTSFTGTLTIPSTITRIGNHTFSGNNFNGTLNIPNSVTSIGDYAFSECSSLTSVAIPNSVNLIGEYAFSNCKSLTGTLVIPNSVVRINGYAFRNCNGLNEVTIPKSTIWVGMYAFENCTSLTTLNYNAENATMGGDYNSYNLYPVFSGCSNLRTFNIGESVNVIPELAFFDCNGLTSISIPNSVTVIGENAFNSTGWYDNQPNNSVLYLDNCCLGYKGRGPWKIFTLKEGTRIIADCAFTECNTFNTIYIPNSVTHIGEWAFYGCDLTSITSFCTTPPKCGNDAFYGAYSALLSVPEYVKKNYVSAKEWCKFSNIQEIAGVKGVEADDNVIEVSRYDIHGRLLCEPTCGVNIIKMSDGSTRKEVVK